jgi:hypothetical protein
VLSDGDVEVRDLCAVDLDDPTGVHVVAVEHVVVNADDGAFAIPLDELVQHAPRILTGAIEEAHKGASSFRVPPRMSFKPGPDRVNVIYRGVPVYDSLSEGQEIDHLGQRWKIVRVRPAADADDQNDGILHEVFVEPIKDD